MTTHPILGHVAPIESLGRAVLEAIESSGGCSIPQVLADINARALELPVSGSEQKVEWIPIDDVLSVVKASTREEWRWYLNSRCKYIDLRVDMRDGCCVLKDRNGRLITLDQLKHQATGATP
jgi:hypothetical protein